MVDLKHKNLTGAIGFIVAKQVSFWIGPVEGAVGNHIVNVDFSSSKEPEQGVQVDEGKGDIKNGRFNVFPRLMQAFGKFEFGLSVEKGNEANIF